VGTGFAFANNCDAFAREKMGQSSRSLRVGEDCHWQRRTSCGAMSP
jgi:hypothetical protein